MHPVASPGCDENLSARGGSPAPAPPYVDDDVEGVIVGEEDANAAAVLHDSVVVEGQFVHRGPGSGLGAGSGHLTGGPGRPRSPRVPSLRARGGLSPTRGTLGFPHPNAGTLPTRQHVPPEAGCPPKLPNAPRHGHAASQPQRHGWGSAGSQLSPKNLTQQFSSPGSGSEKPQERLSWHH